MVPHAPIFQLLGQSPLRPLQSHMEKAYTCVELLLPFFQAVLQENWDEAHRYQQQIVQLEREADELKKELRLHLPKSFFLPAPRSVLLDILTMQDRLPNQAKDIAGLVYGRHMRLPSSIAELFMPFLQRCLAAAKQAQQVIKELDQLQEKGFRGNEVKIMENMIVQLDQIEHDTDQMQIEIRQRLFQLEATLPPVDSIFLYKIMEWTGDLADHAHSVGGQLYLLLAR